MKRPQYRWGWGKQRSKRYIKGSPPKFPGLNSVRWGPLGALNGIRVVEFLNRTFEVDTYTVVVVALLAGWSGVLTMHVLSRTLLALVFVPGFVFGALVANYLFIEYAFYPTPDQETNVVLACTLGIIMALLVLLIVTRIGAALMGTRVSRHRFRQSRA